MGKRYIIEHVIAETKRKTEESVYQGYVTDMLKYIVNNTAEQEQRMMIEKSYRDLIEPQITEEVEVDNEKKANDIINNIRNKLKGG